MVIKRSPGRQAAGGGRSTSKSTCEVPAWTLTAFGDWPAYSMSKFSASVNSDLWVWSYQLTSDLSTRVLQWSCLKAVSVSTFVLGGLWGSNARSDLLMGKQHFDWRYSPPFTYLRIMNISQWCTIPQKRKKSRSSTTGEHKLLESCLDVSFSGCKSRYHSQPSQNRRFVSFGRLSPFFGLFTTAHRCIMNSHAATFISYYSWTSFDSFISVWVSRKVHIQKKKKKKKKKKKAGRWLEWMPATISGRISFTGSRRSMFLSRSAVFTFFLI